MALDLYIPPCIKSPASHLHLPRPRESIEKLFPSVYDYLVPVDDVDPEVLQINIMEAENDHGKYSNTYLPFSVDALEYTGKKVLAIPKCCRKRKGTQDRQRVNESVLERDGQH
ncbi:uncharacterized protein LY79DRAFT_591082 [Colletotrichum navitas]|uniref:Uncharacterized protein n=1 Tax=Colletotrichum navitas TaxID=681940 RepID=A0AAD8PWV8_9PEZI|nr:uncharacterized protein LY79DRAFT_591082 [Colletotrichum navitas]KAK1586190.1 hypothetical protein LY79DRAFT_591082 [Colletotrichum navitas]